jgi:hypothetical protein
LGTKIILKAFLFLILFKAARNFFPPPLHPKHISLNSHLFCSSRVSADHIPLDGSTASLLLPVDTPPDRVRSFLAENAAEAAKRFQKLEAALKLVKPMLGVKSLTYQPGMDVDHLKEALERLSQAQDQIRPFVNNINLVIAKQYGINEDQQQLMIKWNFYL